MKVGIIVSTGFNLASLGPDWSDVVVETTEGIIPFSNATIGDVEVYAARRNGWSKACPPHKVNYAGIIAAFKEAGVHQIVATSVVGSLSEAIEPGTIVVLDQFLDFTKHRVSTAFKDGAFAFCDFTEPYCPELRGLLIEGCREQGSRYRDTGCYVGVDGPRYETAAEVRMYGRLGGDVVGMTNIPECILARESGICYASASLVVNYGAGIVGPVTREDCYDNTIKHIGEMEGLLAEAIKRLPQTSLRCSCSEVAADMIRLQS
ncbi:methylthioadenosine phosphorylase [Paenibacillus sp. 598K]|uniref:MTAP family purine nucleoside phosphorylase n=1 Tax=Paenibacillus sp. 598K TaxID=1117987 RepID=UPI000FFA8F6B|nr:MTAP family purine nucleoside phosphorylase [Paenibacillus sp. 598K]GBF75041.1 methylthioadenosine phosphorylase [Paenibacillus sp. 598K]